MRSLRTLLPARVHQDVTPVPFTTPAGRINAMMGHGGPRVADMELYGAVGSLFGIVSRTSNSTSKVEWQLYRKAARNPDKGARTLVEKHAALDLWSNPNPFMARQELVEATQQHIDLVGEGWWVVGRSGMSSIPLELWPVRPDRMAPVPHPVEYISGYVYFGPGGERIPLGLDEVIQLKMPNPMDPYRGLGAVSSVRSVAESRYYSIEWNKNFFRNSAEPGGFIKFDKTLSDVEFKRWQTRWREQHQGVAAAHRVGILENASWESTGITQRDMQFTELTRMSGDMMREAFGIHKASLGLSDEVNLANAHAAQVLFAGELLVPRLDRIKGKLNNQLLPLFDADPMLEFDYEDPRPRSEEQENASLTARVNAAKALLELDADWDETLAAFELPAIPRGEPRPALPVPAGVAEPVESS